VNHSPAARSKNAIHCVHNGEPIIIYFLEYVAKTLLVKNDAQMVTSVSGRKMRESVEQMQQSFVLRKKKEVDTATQTTFFGGFICGRAQLFTSSINDLVVLVDFCSGLGQRISFTTRIDHDVVTAEESARRRHRLARWLLTIIVHYVCHSFHDWHVAVNHDAVALSVAEATA
jgi:hypothetical protein